MVERPIKVQIPFLLLAFPFLISALSTQDSGPWFAALGVYVLAGGMTAISLWPIAYRTPLTEIFGRFVLIAVGALATALLCALLTTGSLDGLFTKKPRQVAPRTINTAFVSP
jgi:hypothetical protein